MDELRILDIQTAQRNGVHAVSQGRGWALANKQGVTLGPYWGKSADEAWSHQVPRFTRDYGWALDLVKDMDYVILYSPDIKQFRVSIQTQHTYGYAVGKASTIPHAITLAWNKWWEFENNA